MTTPEPLVRTQHRNLVTGADIVGSTVHRESRVDIEEYLEPMAAVRAAALHGPGVATGLRVTALAGQAGLKVSPGVAIDGRGRTVALRHGSVAVTARTADARTARNVPAVTVAADGVAVETTGLVGDHLLTVVWAESEVGGTRLRHAPWLQLLPAGDPGTAVDAIVLAQVALDPGGVVTALTAGGRSTLGGRLRLFAPKEDGAPDLAVDQSPTAELRAHPGGGLDVVTTGPTTVGGPLSVAGPLTAAGPLSVAGLLTAELLAAGTVAVVGPLAVGIDSGAARRPLHVEGSEIHSGGPGAGYSFADRGHAGFRELPDAGQRWVWYASGGSARLWSGVDRLAVSPDGTLTAGAAGLASLRVSGNATVGAGADGVLNVRHVHGKRSGTDDPDDLFLNWNTGRDVHVGGGVHASRLRVSGELLTDATISTPSIKLTGSGITSNGRVRVSGEELLFLLNKQGVIVSTAGGGNGQLAVDGNLGSGGKHPVDGLPSGWGGGVHTWDVYAQGSIGCGPAGIDGNHVPAGLNRDGAVWGRSKRFVIDHPLRPETCRLAHGCVEGPELAVYYRGSARLADGRRRVTLPAYFEALVRAEGRTVLLTPIADGDGPVSMLAAAEIVDGAFDVRAVDDHNPGQRFCWEVKAVRADVEPLEVEVEVERRPAAVEEAGTRA